MNKRTEEDLAELGTVLDRLLAKYEKMSEPDKIDLAARLKPVAKFCKKIDDEVKDEVKRLLRHRDGTRLGSLFKAVLTLVPTHRLNQTKLKENEPEIFDEYYEDVTDERVTFELR